MKPFADPMLVLLSFQKDIECGRPIDPRDEDSYLELFDEPGGGKRYSFIKIVEKEVQAIAIFGLEDPINGVPCYSVGYAVGEGHRKRGLAVKAVRIPRIVKGRSAAS